MKKILVVDDEEDVLEVLRLVLAKNGYEVLTAASGMDSLTRAQSEIPDLIVLDIMMQQMDGWEVLKLFKLDERTSAIPVVILSARVEPKDKIRGLQEGAIDYVTKPFAVREILTRIAAILGRSPAPPAGPAGAAGTAGTGGGE
ncbi:MAG TPA: response regulator [Thermoanaerobaculia bacterium]|nr:response regulator [Thermoanaerobaculia bacterium]